MIFVIIKQTYWIPITGCQTKPVLFNVNIIQRVNTLKSALLPQRKPAMCFLYLVLCIVLSVMYTQNFIPKIDHRMKKISLMAQTANHLQL